METVYLCSMWFTPFVREVAFHFPKIFNRISCMGRHFHLAASTSQMWLTWPSPFISRLCPFLTRSFGHDIVYVRSKWSWSYLQRVVIIRIDEPSEAWVVPFAFGVKLWQEGMINGHQGWVHSCLPRGWELSLSLCRSREVAPHFEAVDRIPPRKVTLEVAFRSQIALVVQKLYSFTKCERGGDDSFIGREHSFLS